MKSLNEEQEEADDEGRQVHQETHNRQTSEDQGQGEGGGHRFLSSMTITDRQGKTKTPK